MGKYTHKQRSEVLKFPELYDFKIKLIRKIFPDYGLTTEEWLGMKALADRMTEEQLYGHLKREGYVAYSEWTGAITAEELSRIHRSRGDGITVFK